MGMGEAERGGVMLPLSSVLQAAKLERGPRWYVPSSSGDHPKPQNSIPDQATHLIQTWPFKLLQCNKITSYQQGFY